MYNGSTSLPIVPKVVISTLLCINCGYSNLAGWPNFTVVCNVFISKILLLSSDARNAGYVQNCTFSHFFLAKIDWPDWYHSYALECFVKYQMTDVSAKKHPIAMLKILFWKIPGLSSKEDVFFARSYRQECSLCDGMVDQKRTIYGGLASLTSMIQFICVKNPIISTTSLWFRKVHRKWCSLVITTIVKPSEIGLIVHSCVKVTRLWREHYFWDDR
jgi:hypothetical protein